MWKQISVGCLDNWSSSTNKRIKTFKKLISILNLSTLKMLAGTMNSTISVANSICIATKFNGRTYVNGIAVQCWIFKLMSL